MNKPDVRKLSQDAQEALRQQAIRLHEQGKSWQEISGIVGANICTVREWGRRYQAQGEAGLASGKRGRRCGEGRSLLLATELRIRDLVATRRPEQLDLPFALWTRRAVQALMRREAGLEMPIRTVGEYLRRWGFTPQRPYRQALEQSAAAVDTWLNDTWPGICARAQAEHAEIHWADETAVQDDTHWARGYAPCGQTPALATCAKRHGLSMISAVTRQGLVRFSIYEGAMNTELFIGFLDGLIRDTERKTFLIVDNLRVHHAVKVREWLEKENRSKKLELFFLPSYSPMLNPDEYFNRDLKTTLRLGPVARTAAAMRAKAEAFMALLAKAPERVKSYFSSKQVAYAA